MNIKIKIKKNKKIFFSIGIVAFFSLLIFLVSSLFTLNNFKNSIESKDTKKIESFSSFKNKILSIPIRFKVSSMIEKELITLSSDYEKKILSEEKYLELLNSYKKLNLKTKEINDKLINLPIVQNSENYLNLGINYFTKENYAKALECFEEINENTESYKKAEEYINKSFKKVTEATFNRSDNLVKETNYTEAINYLLAIKESFKDHEVSDIDDKIKEIKDLRMAHLYKYSEESIESNVNNAGKLKPYFGKLTKDNINDFEIKSKTSRFIFTDIQKQKTYIFKGSNKNWTLEKDFDCSTGIDNKETLVGYFETIVKAPWFFSPKYGQGGKNYIQFKGEYLYHSIPLAADQKTVLDYTLGEPASHGCIRLELNDSKWLYDNIVEGTTVLIF